MNGTAAMTDSTEEEGEGLRDLLNELSSKPNTD